MSKTWFLFDEIIYFKDLHSSSNVKEGHWHPDYMKKIYQKSDIISFFLVHASFNYVFLFNFILVVFTQVLMSKEPTGTQMQNI